jgi:nicotinamidase-related amidase
MNNSMIRRIALASLLFWTAVFAAPKDTSGRVLRLNLRTRVEAFKGSAAWQEVHFEQNLPVSRSAILICDMWNDHWCKGASRRVGVLATRMEPLLEQARSAGIQIIHAPSDVMDFYKDAPQRQRMIALEKIDPPANLHLADPPLPIDDSGGGCDTPEKFYKAWSREISTLKIGPDDVISDKGSEIYSLLKRRGIDTLLVMGVHANMCILNRTFAIKQMTNWGVRCILVRDLTDAMYNPHDRPYVSHEQGTELVIEHIEKYWAPSVLSDELSAAVRASR